MANITPTSTGLGSNTSPDSSGGSESPNTDSTKIGRPSKWSASRQRKLARLYLFTTLQPKDIREALREKDPEWMPGKESTNKIANLLLDKDPRWLRPRNREEMNDRVMGLSDRKVQRKSSRCQSPKQPTNAPIDPAIDIGSLASPQATSGPGFAPHPANNVLFSDFSETPMQDLLSLFPYQTFDDEESLLSTVMSISSLERRLSKRWSAVYLKTIARLLKTHSVSHTFISNSDASTTTERINATTVRGGSISNTHTIGPVSPLKTRRPSCESKVALPDVLLVLDRHIKRQGVCLPGLELHDSGNCWCLDDLDGQLWVDKHGLGGMTIGDPPNSLSFLDLDFQDIFGNNVLHMLAARGAELYLMVEALDRGVDGNSRNLAGQSFLHVLPRQTIRWLAGDRDGLMWFLQKLNYFNIRFHDCDVFGRNFFHLLTRQAKHLDQNSLEVLDFLNVPILPTYDAFGWESCLRTGEPILPPPSPIDNQELETFTRLSSCRRYRVSCVDTALSNLKDFPNECVVPDDITKDILPNITRSDLQITGYGRLLFNHARMLEMAWLSIEVPTIQDPLGRNGLQCLAEVSLCLDIDALQRPNEQPKKRKRGDSGSKTSSKRLTFRYELVQAMIDVGVDLNNYDSLGNTVLMAFVTHLLDGEDDRTLTDILKLLIKRGADIHRRNRQGETALHVAVRLGRKVATRVLLKHGANIHARTAKSKGMLALGEAHYLKAREDVSLYASIMACMALCTGFGAVAAPTWVQEWSAQIGPSKSPEAVDNR